MRLTRRLWLMAITTMLTFRFATADDIPTLRLTAGVNAAYQVRQQTSLALTVNGKIQEESVSSAMRLNATVKERDGQGRTAIELQADRLEATAKRFKNEYSLEASRRKQDAKLATAQFAPLVALLDQPVQLLYADGKLAGVEGNAYAAKIGELLKRDFQGSEEYEFASPVYSALASDTALLAAWKNVVAFQFPQDTPVGEAWDESADITFASDVPSEAWLGVLQASVKTSSRIVDTNAQHTMIDSKVEVAPSDPRTTNLGPNEFDYRIQNGAGERTTVVDASGLVQSLKSKLDITASGHLKFGGKELPVDIRVTFTQQVERVDD